jgi:amino acid adenylation domain-containing protein
VTSTSREYTGTVAQDIPGLPLLPIQQALWLDELRRGPSATYNVPLAFRFSATVDPGRLAGALDAVAARHPYLRGRISAIEGVPRLIPADQARIPVSTHDLRGLAPDAQARQVDDWTARPLTLDRSPLIAAALFETADDERLLVINVHHACFDSWSAEVVRRDLELAYRGRLGPAPRDREIQLRLRAELRAERLDDTGPALLDYWRHRLRDLPAETTWPGHRSRPERPTHRGGVVRFGLSPAVSTGLQRLGRRLRATPFTVFATALQVLLARVADPDHNGDVAIGTPVALRGDPADHDTVAYLANTVVLRQAIDLSRSFEDLLRDATRDIRNDLRHADYPFPWAVRHLARERSLSRPPLVQVLLVVEDAPATALDLDGLRGEPRALHTGTAKFDLTVTLVTTPDGYEGSVEYSADLYDEATARVFADSFAELLGQLPQQPSVPVGELAIAGPAAGQASDPGPGAGQLPLVHELFTAHVATRPDSPAVVWSGDRQLSYRQLDVASAALAAEIRAAMGPGDELVAIHARRSPALVVAVLAVLRAAAAYLPLDPALPRRRIEHMLTDGRPFLVLCDPQLADSVDYPTGARILTLPDPTSATAPAVPAPAPAPRVDASGPAYVIYTSGSTGVPKAVELAHAGLANLIAWQTRRSRLGAHDVTLQFASLGFDVAFQELFATWATGGTLRLIDDEERRDPLRLLDHLERHRVHRVFLPFVALQALAEAAQQSGRIPRHLREVVTAGEQLVVTPAIRDFFRSTGARLDNQYGPSETHVVSAEQLLADPGSWPELPSIGRPIPATTIAILDRGGQRLPPGVPGEICVAGVALARGYRARPELTAERFVSSADGVRWYHTGDIGRRGHDGRIHFLGRRDNQIKIRGYRVELGEIEAHLKALPGIADAVVVSVDRPHGKRLVAFCIPSGGELSGPDLRRALAATLPEYMVPSDYASVTAFPLTGSGKVDRERLARTPVAGPDPTATSWARDKIELELVALWRDLLGRDTVGLFDDFFDLGGHSLLGVRLLAAVHRSFGVELTLADILLARTVSGLAEAVRAGGCTTARGPLTRVQIGDGQSPVYVFPPLSGTVMRYGAFARALGVEQPVWGVQSPGLEAGESPLDSIDAMADHFLDALRAVHPGGPWYLVGYSMGGILAVEVARRLRALGAPVGLTGVVDTRARSDHRNNVSYAIGILARLMLRLDVDLDELLRLNPAEQSRRLYDLGTAAGTLPGGYDEERIRRMLEMYGFNAAALAGHEMTRYDAPVALYRASDRSMDDGVSDPLLGWAEFVPEVRAYDVPGDHHHMMEPGNVEVLARLVRGQVRPDVA